MKREPLIIFGLLLITLVALGGVLECGFTNFDDPDYVLNNPHVLGGLTWANFKWAWTTFYAGNYLPLTWLSLMADVSVLGRRAAGFHLVNLALHLMNAIFLFTVLREATAAVWRSALVAAIFAIHPLRVESVAWIVERKDVLTAFFGLLAMLAYLRYVRESRGRWGSYALTLLLFAAALLAKQTLATLPCVLLLMDFWPLGRWQGGPDAASAVQPPRRSVLYLIVEKLPMFAMVAAIILVTFAAQAGDNSVSSLTAVPPLWRLGNGLVSYVRYLGKMLWFGHLAVFYPPEQWSAWAVVPSGLLLAAITTVAISKLRSWPWLAVGWFWFLGVLVPMIGIVQCGPQAMADRFTYFSTIGLLLIIAWSIPASLGKYPMQLGTIVGAVLIALILFTARQTARWTTSRALFTQAVEVADSWRAELNLGNALFEEDKDHPDIPAAMKHWEIARRMGAPVVQVDSNFALALATVGEFDRAIALARHLVNADPTNPRRLKVLEFVQRCQSAESHRLHGIQLCNLGKIQQGIDEFKQALAMNPASAAAMADLRKYQPSSRSK